MTLRLFKDEYLSLVDKDIAKRALTQFFLLLLEQPLDLSAAIQANAAGLHPLMENILALFTAGGSPDVAS